MNRRIPVIADDYVTMEFGSGAVKITPASDPNDFAMAGRHNLEIIRIMDDNAVINENGGVYQGQDRYECRQKRRPGSGGAGLPRRHGAVYAQHRPVLPLQDRHRARRLPAVVRQDRAPGQGGDRRGGHGKDPHHSRPRGRPPISNG